MNILVFGPYTRCLYLCNHFVIVEMAVVSVRVDEKVKQRLKEAGIDVPREVKRHLEELAWQLELKDRLARLDEVLVDMPPTPKEFSAKSVREDRDKGH
jgi:hypothetical protein